MNGRRYTLAVLLIAGLAFLILLKPTQALGGGGGDTGGYCGDLICQEANGEDCNSCPADCGACAPFCGDASCDPGETCSNCAADCGACAPSCGDAVCDSGAGEDCTTCVADCGTCPSPPSAGYCGDSICDIANGEDCTTCSADCGSCSIPESGYCGDSICQEALSEDCNTCAADCGSCPPSAPPAPPTGVCSVGSCDYPGKIGCTSNSCCPGLACQSVNGQKTCVGTCGLVSAACSSGSECCSGSCVQCAANSDCSYGQECHNNVCTGCTSNATCTHAGDRCVNGACQYWCTSNSDCTQPGATNCNIPTGECVECLPKMNGDPVYTGVCITPPLLKCSSNFQCVECTQSSQCAGNENGPICGSGDTLNVCGCTANSDCTGRKICDIVVPHDLGACTCPALTSWNSTSGQCDCDNPAATWNGSTCITPVPYCGDGIIQSGFPRFEKCDSSQLAGKSCSDFSSGGINFTGGSLNCYSNATASPCDFDTSSCTLPSPQTYYQDSDGDGYGNPNVDTSDYSAPDGYVSDNTDCNDGNASIHPGAAEICNNIDNNCVNGIADEVKTTYYQDADGDTYGNAAVSTQACSAPPGYVADNTDCNDGTAAAHPGLAESCSDEIDNNCNGQTNEGCVENTLAQCNDAVDNDIDGQTDFADATPTYVAAGSCNICNANACDGLDGVGIPLLPSTSISEPNAPAGYKYFNATANHAGGPGAYRIDDGSLSPASCWCQKCDAPGYAWNGSTSKCEPTQPLDCSNPNSAPTVNQFTATAFYGGYANDDVTLYLDGTVTVGPGNFQIDTDGNVGNGYEVSSNNDFSTFVSNLGAGTYTFNAKVTEGASCLTPRSATSQVQITINPNSAPTVSLSNTVTPHWLNSSVTFDFMVSDEKPNIAYTIDFGDGTSYNANTGGSNSVSGSVTHTYLSEGSFTARITATDAGTPALQGTTTSNVNSVFLDCVQGSQTGTPTYTNDASQCCSETNPQNPTNAVSCSAPVAGWQNCFATTSCYPGQGTICSTVLGQPTPTMWRNRDYDQTHCTIAPTQTCNSYPWTDYANASLPEPYCCGDDNGEVLAVRVFGGGSACCPGANQCYTTVGASPGCYDGIENTLAKCSNGNDDDCDGLVDIADTDCQPAQISGHVTIDDGSPLVGIDVNITINGVTAHKVTDTNGYYSFTAGDLVGAAIGNHNVYAYKFGYTTEKETINFAPGNTYTVDFTLHGRRCNDDCTNDQGYCDSSCVGVGACNPTPVERQTLDACHPQGAPFGLRKGTEVVLDTNETSQQMLVGICCSVAPSWRSAPAVTVVDAGSIDVNMQKIDTLVKYTRLITLNGKTYRLVISTW